MKSLKKYKFLIKFIIKTALICGIFWFVLTFCDTDRNSVGL